MNVATLWLMLLGWLAAPASPSKEVLDSSQIKEDPVAGKKAEAEFLKRLAREDRHLWLLFDRQHLRQHQAVLVSLVKARARYERVRSKRTLDSARQDVGILLDDARKKMRDIDEWRNGSKIFADYDVLIQLIETDYPAALQASLGGNKRALFGVRREFDAQLKKIRSWLAKAAREPEDERD